MVLAEGGTAGPPTGHMIVAARAKAIEGPWENSPTTRSFARSRRRSPGGQGTERLVEAPDGRWFIVYHAYENGFYTLGRQTLLEPIEWTADGWFQTAGSDAAKPIQACAGRRPHGLPFSDGFSTPHGRPVELLQGLEGRSRALSIRKRWAGPEGARHVTGRLVAAVVRQR